MLAAARTASRRSWIRRGGVSRHLSNQKGSGGRGINAQETLRKAAAGELTHKNPPIPKLMGRTKHVASLQHQSSRDSKQAWDLLDEQSGGGGGGGGGDSWGGGSPWDDNPGTTPPASKAVMDRSVQSMELLLMQYANDPRYYWNEEDYDPIDETQLLEAEPSPPPPRQLEASSDPEVKVTDAEEIPNDEEPLDETEDDGVLDPDAKSKDIVAAAKENKEAVVDPIYDKWLDTADIIQALAKDEETDPLQNMSMGQLAEFKKNMETIKEGADMWDPDPQHMYFSERYENPHPDSKREPKPNFPRNRSQPPITFVERFSRFIYVTGLCPLDFNADLANPVHQNLIKKSIAGLFEVDSSQVWPTNLNSGFIGFNDAPSAIMALVSGPSPDHHSRPPIFSTQSEEMAEKHKDFGSKETTLVLENLPKQRFTSASLLRELFPPNSEIGEAYHNVKPGDIKFVSSTKALIRFQSIDESVSILHQSKILTDRLQEIGRYRIRMFRARRELVHAGYGAFPLREEGRKLGPRLLVHGDMPTRPFYLSHAECLLAVNIDPSWSAQDISARVQEHCTMKRDPTGSVEFVTCEQGHRTGQAYIGFDLPGEADAALKAFGPTVRWGDRMVILKRTKDRKYPHQEYKGPERRLDRPTEALLDDLNNWEKFVDPADVQKLYDAGITKQVLDDALRAIRWNNATFGQLDSAMREESLEPEKETGQQYRDLVQLYIETLIECLPNPNAENLEDMNIPDVYHSLFQPGEDIDMGIFEKELEKQAAQQKFRTTGKL